MGIVVVSADGSGICLPCLGHVLLKAILCGRASLRRFRDGVLHVRPSSYAKWVKILRIHANLTSRIT